jgi:hypothetical protein
MPFVFGTPMMILAMEMASAAAEAPHLPAARGRIAAERSIWRASPSESPPFEGGEPGASRRARPDVQPFAGANGPQSIESPMESVKAENIEKRLTFSGTFG